MRQKTVLFAPLDWGLGHTTRCLPLMRALTGRGAEILFAGTETQRNFIRNSFPDIECLPLAGYGVTYSRYAGGFLPKMLQQAPRILRAIRGEQDWLLQLAKRRTINGIISDNRYGLWHPAIPSVIMTHQLRVRTGLGSLTDSGFQRLHYRMLERFQQCWVVDEATAPGLSGVLAHPASIPRNARYIGPLSQFTRRSREAGTQGKLVVLLSGPEPQRSILSDLLWPQVAGLDTAAVFIEGKADAPPRRAPRHVQWIAQCDGPALESTLLDSSYVVCRGGYSTVMDAAALGLKLITIPTPGQTEQQYLTRSLGARGKVMGFQQQDFDLGAALRKAAEASWQPFTELPGKPAFSTVVNAWYEGL